MSEATEEKKNEEQDTGKKDKKEDADLCGLWFLGSHEGTDGGKKFWKAVYRWGGVLLLLLVISLGLKIALSILALVLSIGAIATGRTG